MFWHPATKTIALTGLAAAVLLPMIGSLAAAVLAALDGPAWRALFHHPQTWQALAMSLWTGLASGLLALAATAWILATTVGRQGRRIPIERMHRWLAPLLAVPHAAFAIGLVAILAPGGWVLRFLSPWATGLTTPPGWPITQDPWGLGLIATLVLKEVPFLLWIAWAHLQRPDVAHRLQRELQWAHTAGYSQAQAWWRVGWPQLLPRLHAPLLAVGAYSLSVVDVALVIGPTTPPTLAMLAWQWLQDADPATNAQGSVAAWLLAAMLAACVAVAWGTHHWPGWRRRWTSGIAAPLSPLPPGRNRAPSLLLAGLVSTYVVVLLALALGSFFGPWPFPQLVPEAFTASAWQHVVQSRATLWTSVWLALASGGSALAWAVAWLEFAPLRWQQRLLPLWLLPLVLPAVLWTVGLHRLSLAWGLDATATGLWLAHTLAAIPYVLIALQGPYLGFDKRLQQVSASLGRRHPAFLWSVKWPLLRSTLASAMAIGCAVSLAQYLPTLYVGAGRFQTVTTEAVNLAAGGQRSLTAAFAWMQWILPVIVFAAAAWAGRTRHWHAGAQFRP